MNNRSPLIACAMALLSLAGCEDRGECLRSYTEFDLMLMPVGTTYQMRLVPRDVCDEWQFPNGREAAP